MACFKRYLDPLSPHQLKKTPPPQKKINILSPSDNTLDPRLVYVQKPFLKAHAEVSSSARDLISI